MPRIATQTALATILGAAIAAPAMAQQSGENCPGTSLRTDADGNNVITAEEARTAAENEFARFDVNKDEKITREEFIGCFAAPATDMTKQQPATESARTEESFARADLDKDGKIDRAEFGLGAQQAFDQIVGLAETGTPTAEETESVAAGQEEVVTEQDVPGANMAEAPLTDEAEAASAGSAPAAETAAEARSPEIPEEGGLAVVQDPEGTPQDVGEPGARAPEVVEERFLESPYADFPTVQDRQLTVEEIAFNTAELFAALDANRDRVLDAAEWMRIGPIAERGPADLGRVFEALDTDENTVISLGEYVTSVAAAQAEAARAAAERQQTAGSAGDAAEQAAQARETTGDAAAAAGEQTTGNETAQGEQAAGAPVFLYRLYRF